MADSKQVIKDLDRVIRLIETDTKDIPAEEKKAMVKGKNFILIYISLVAIVIGILLASVITFYTSHKNDDRIQG